MPDKKLIEFYGSRHFRAKILKGDGLIRKWVFFLKVNTIIKADSWLSSKCWEIRVKLRWHAVMFLLGDVMEITHYKKYPANYVTIADRERRIPYGLWKFDGKTLTRVRSMPKNNEVDHQ